MKNDEYYYQIGGTLNLENPLYVQRETDSQLYQSLKSGEFCYVLDCRQMGKSSLLVRTKHRLEKEGCKCAIVDLTNLGSETTTYTQWYKGLMAELWLGFKLVEKFNFQQWWKNQGEFSLPERLNRFMAEVLLVQFPQDQVFIFIDEIDTILSLNFPVSDFFALIRFWYNQRAVNPEYSRLVCAIFGVATPSDLIADKHRTPFNIGRAIHLYGFKLNEALPLAKGLEGKVDHPQIMLQEILGWTGGQPFLTQKLCKLVVEAASRKVPEAGKRSETEAFWVENIVRLYLINRWESQDEPEHLRTIRDRLLRNVSTAGRILSIYQQILQGLEIKSDDSREQIELLLSGLLVKKQGLLQVKNRIYQEVFNLAWVEQQLSNLRPYSQTFAVWVESQKTDESRLLRGQALKDAQIWSQGKSLSDLDYQFLAKSAELDQKETQLALEAARTKEVEARLAAEEKERIQAQKTTRWQRILLGVATLAFLVSSGLGLTAFWQYRQAKKNEVQAIAQSSSALFASDQRLKALVEAIKAKQLFDSLGVTDTKLQKQVETALQTAVYGANQLNSLSGHQGGVLSVYFSPDGRLIATASNDKTVKLWQPDGKLLTTLNHTATVHRVRFSADSQKLAAAGLDGQISLWEKDGKQIKTWPAHNTPIWSLAFSPDGQTIASASGDKTIKFWQLDGTLLNTLKGHQAGIWSVEFSPDGQLIASAGLDGTIKIWQRDGSLFKTLTSHTAPVWDITFSPDGNLLASGSGDKTVKLWQRDGTLLQTLSGHQGEIYKVEFSPDGQIIASSGADKTIRLWQRNGGLIKILRGHHAIIREIAFSPDSQVLASASDDTKVKLWRLKNPLQTNFNAHETGVWGLTFSPDGKLLASTALRIKLWQAKGNLVKNFPLLATGAVNTIDFSPDGQLIVSGGDDNTVRLWRTDGTLVRVIGKHQDLILGVAFSPDGQMVISGSDDNTLRLWGLDGSLRQTFKGHSQRIWSVAFSPDSEFVASASEDGTVKVWQINGKLITTLTGHNNAVWGVAISPNSQIIASASRDGTVKLWQSNGKLIRTLTGTNPGFSRVDFSPNGEMIAAAGMDNTVTLWKTDGTLLRKLYGHTASLLGVAFSPDNKLIASGGDDQSLIVWNLDPILNLDFLQYSCDWVHDYLRTNAEVEQSDRTLCDGK